MEGMTVFDPSAHQMPATGRLSFRLRAEPALAFAQSIFTLL
jgi:hypothetical protein